MNIQNLMAFASGDRTAAPALNSAAKLDATRTEADDTVAPAVSNPTLFPSSSSQATGEEFETFLTLLTAQIKNQDPLAPLDSTQFVEQLATFSSLELQAKGNQTLDVIVDLLRQQSEEP